MVILLAGTSGLLGTALSERLSDSPMRQLVRRGAEAPHEVQWDPSKPLPASLFDGVTAVINLGGAGVGDKRWSPRRIEQILDSRVVPTSTLAHGLAQHASGTVRYLQASAVGFYGDTGDSVTDESAPPGNTTLAGVCEDWEAAAAPAVAAGHDVTFLRTGIVLSKNGGALTPLLRLLKLGLGGPLGSGQQWWPWIHIEDWVRAVLFLLQNAVRGPANLTAPQPVTNRELTREIAAALNRPAFVPAPGFALKMALGGFAEEILRSQRVVPTALVDHGFEFTYPDISSAAHALT